MRSGFLLAVVLGFLFVALALLVLNHGGTIAGIPDDDFGSLVYGTALVAVIGAGLLTAFRGQWGQAVKSAVIWIAAFAALIAVYAFGPEFRAVGDRMLAVLRPGSAVEVAGSNGRQVMVTRAGDAHFHIDVSVNGTEVPFLVDTGASVVAIDRDVAARIGIDPNDLNYTMRIQTANGVASAAPVRLDTVRVGNIERRNVRAVVTEGDGIGVGLLGMSFLGSLSSFDFRGDRLVLSD